MSELLKLANSIRDRMALKATRQQAIPKDDIVGAYLSDAVNGIVNTVIGAGATPAGKSKLLGGLKLSGPLLALGVGDTYVNRDAKQDPLANYKPVQYSKNEADNYSRARAADPSFYNKQYLDEFPISEDNVLPSVAPAASNTALPRVRFLESYPRLNKLINRIGGGLGIEDKSIGKTINNYLSKAPIANALPTRLNQVMNRKDFIKDVNSGASVAAQNKMIPRPIPNAPKIGDAFVKQRAAIENNDWNYKPKKWVQPMIKKNNEGILLAGFMKKAYGQNWAGATKPITPIKPAVSTPVPASTPAGATAMKGRYGNTPVANPKVPAAQKMPSTSMWSPSNLVPGLAHGLGAPGRAVANTVDRAARGAANWAGGVASEGTNTYVNNVLKNVSTQTGIDPKILGEHSTEIMNIVKQYKGDPAGLQAKITEFFNPVANNLGKQLVSGGLDTAQQRLPKAYDIFQDPQKGVSELASGASESFIKNILTSFGLQKDQPLGAQLGSQAVSAATNKMQQLWNQHGLWGLLKMLFGFGGGQQQQPQQVASVPAWMPAANSAPTYGQPTNLQQQAYS